MDKQEQEFQMAQHAAQGDNGRSGTIHHANYERQKQHQTNNEQRKRQQALLELAQEFAETKARILSQLPELHNKIDETRRLAQDALSDAESNAQRDENNRMVFRDKDGHARYKDGSLVPAEEADKITWREDATSWEEYKKPIDVLERLTENIYCLQRVPRLMASISCRASLILSPIKP